MTKTDEFAIRTGGEDIANLDIAIRDDHTVNQQFDQLAFLLEGSVFETGLDTLAEVFHTRYEPGEFVLALHLGRQLLQLVLKRTNALFNFMASSLVFDERNDTAQIGVCQAIELLLQTGLAAAKIFLTSLEFLGEPGASVGALQGPGNEVRVAQQVTQIVPDEVV